MLLHDLVAYNGESAKIAFALKCCISTLPEFNQLLDFFSLFDSRLILKLLYDCLNLVISAISWGLLGGMVQEKGSRESHSSGLLHAQCMCAPMHCLPERKKCPTFGLL